MKTLLCHLTYLAALCGSCYAEFACNTHATILRQIDREGFHIDIHSLVELVIEVEDAWKWENCTLILREQISDSFFVNPDQLSELSRSGTLRACTSDKVDVELPQYLSKPHTVYVYGQFQKSQNLIYSRLKFPLHMRYQKPKPGGGYSFAELRSPALLVRCENIEECKHFTKSRAPCTYCGSELCDWMRVSYKTNAPNFTLPVPVGNLDHLNFITIITYLLTFGGCLYVAVVLLVNTDRTAK